jgi:hypothetical protein
MATPEFNSQEQEGLYRLVIALNSALQFIIKRLQEIAGDKILDPKFIKETSALTRAVDSVLEKKR